METRRDRDEPVRDPIQAAEHMRTRAVERFGQPDTWAAELTAALAATAINPAPTAVWWGDVAEPLHNEVRPAEAFTDPLLTSAVGKLRETPLESGQLADVLELCGSLVYLRALRSDQGTVEGALAIACPSPAVTARSEADLAHCEERVANLERAVESNRQIGVAIGIVMAERRLTQAAAFEVLRSTSQQQHRKLRALADDVVLTGAVPEIAASG